MSDTKVARPDPSQYEKTIAGKLAYVDALVAHHHETRFGKGDAA